MGSALADGSHLPRAGIGKEVCARGYAGAADGCVVDIRPLLRRQVRVRGRSRGERLRPGETRSGNSARLGWADVGGWTKSWRAELEELSVGYVVRLAGECAHQAARALAAAGILGLRNPADRGGGERGEADGTRCGQSSRSRFASSFRP